MSKQKVGTVLKKIFSDRKKKNPQYSLRSFARDLEVSAGRLSRILSGKDEAGNRLIAAIRKSQFFTADERHELNQSLEDQGNPFNGNQPNKGFELDAKDVAGVWNYLAVFSLITIQSVNCTEELISQRLKLDMGVVHESIEFLLRQKLIQKNEEGHYRTISEQMYFQSKPFKALYEAHLNYLLENKKRATEGGDEKTFFGMVTVTLSEQAFKQAKLLLNKTMAKICKDDQPHPNKRVFHVSAQMFALDEGPVTSS